jgi:hypothetical protein
MKKREMGLLTLFELIGCDGLFMESVFSPSWQRNKGMYVLYLLKNEAQRVSFSKRV